MATNPSTGLLQLPKEILIQIARNLSGSIKDDDAQRDLLNLAVACKCLAEPAREALCYRLILHSRKTHLLLKMLFKYPDLRDKVKSLTIETVESQDEMTVPKPIPGFDDGLLHNCSYEVQALAIDDETKGEWIAALSASKFKFHGMLLCLLMTMLPQLEELYLDGSMLFNFPLFHDILTPLEPGQQTFFPMHFNLSKFSMSDWESPNLSFIMGMLSPKLKVLELPNDLRLGNALRGDEGYMHGISSSFPELKLLAVPVCVIENTSCQDIIPPKLETLILTSGNRPTKYWSALTALQDLNDCFPNLHKVSFYRYVRESRDRSMFFDPMIMAKMECYEYIPRHSIGVNCKPLKTCRHAWMYTEDELIEDEDGAYQMSWETYGLRLDKAEWRREQPEFVNEGLRAMRYLFNEDI